MVIKLKAVIDSLREQVIILVAKVKEAEDAKKESDVLIAKAKEAVAVNKEKTKELDKRELAVKHIESIVEALEKAKKLMAEARLSMDNADKRQEDLEEGFKKLAKEATKVEKRIADGEITNNKQADALKKERATFEAKLVAAKSIGVALK